MICVSSCKSSQVCYHCQSLFPLPPLPEWEQTHSDYLQRVCFKSKWSFMVYIILSNKLKNKFMTTHAYTSLSLETRHCSTSRIVMLTVMASGEVFERRVLTCFPTSLDINLVVKRFQSVSISFLLILCPSLVMSSLQRIVYYLVALPCLNNLQYFPLFLSDISQLFK